MVRPAGTIRVRSGPASRSRRLRTARARYRRRPHMGRVRRTEPRDSGRTGRGWRSRPPWARRQSKEHDPHAKERRRQPPRHVARNGRRRPAGHRAESHRQPRRTPSGRPPPAEPQAESDAAVPSSSECKGAAPGSPRPAGTRDRNHSGNSAHGGSFHRQRSAVAVPSCASEWPARHLRRRQTRDNLGLPSVRPVARE